MANHDVTIEYPQPVIDNANGIVSDIGIAIMGTNKGGVVGSGIFCIYHMVGEPQYSVVDVVVADQYGNVIK